MKSEELNAKRQETLRSECRFWIETSPGVRQIQHVFPEVLIWNPLTVIDSLYLLLILLLVPFLITHYYLIDCELNCWRMELLNKCQILTEVTRIKFLQRTLIDTFGQGEQDSPIVDDSSLGKGVLRCDVSGEEDSFGEPCKQVFFENTQFGLFIFACKPFLRPDQPSGEVYARTKFNGCMGLQQLVIDSVPSRDLISDDNRYLTQLEIMYMSFRLFMGHTQHCSDSTSSLSIAIHILDYGLTIIAVWHCHLLSEFTYEHLLVVSIACAWSLSLIILMGNFHAKVSGNN